MSDEKIDLADFETCDGLAVLHTHELLALVRAVRAAREYRVAVEWGFETRNVNATSVELGSALAPFTDSAEVRSDGE